MGPPNGIVLVNNVGAQVRQTLANLLAGVGVASRDTNVSRSVG